MGIGISKQHSFVSDRKLTRRFALFLRTILPKKWFCWISRTTIQCQARLRPHKWSYWTKLTDQIYLGAIPLKNWNHIDKISALGVKAILSINEEHEFKNLPFAKPVKSEDWTKRSMHLLKISSPDLEPLESHKMAEAVMFVMQQVKLGNQVYMHCTAGRGRSASVAICSLAKLHGITPAEAMRQIKEKRPQLSLSKKQLESVQQCYKLL